MGRKSIGAVFAGVGAIGLAGIIGCFILAGKSGAARFLPQYAVNHAFDSATNTRLTQLSDRAESVPHSVTDDDLRWVTSLVAGKHIVDESTRLQYQACANVLIQRKDFPTDLQPACKTIATEMMTSRSANDPHQMIPLMGGVILARLKDPTTVPQMRALLSSSVPENRDRITRAIRETQG